MSYCFRLFAFSLALNALALADTTTIKAKQSFSTNDEFTSINSTTTDSYGIHTGIALKQASGSPMALDVFGTGGSTAYPGDTFTATSSSSTDPLGWASGSATTTSNASPRYVLTACNCNSMTMGGDTFSEPIVPTSGANFGIDVQAKTNLVASGSTCDPSGQSWTDQMSTTTGHSWLGNMRGCAMVRTLSYYGMGTVIWETVQTSHIAFCDCGGGSPYTGEL
jgi:hypothetical protein